MSRRQLPGEWVARKKGKPRWRLPYRTPDGRLTSKVFATKGEAEVFFDDLQVGTRNGTWIEPDRGRMRFAEFAAEWAGAQDWAPSTRESFGSHLRRLARLLGPDTRLDEIGQMRLNRLRSELGREYSTNTATITLHYATTIMRAAHADRRIPADVTTGVKPPKRRGDEDQPVGPDDIPTRDEIVAIFAATPPAYRGIIALGTCGLRVSEALGVTVGQLDVDRRRLDVDRQLVRTDGGAGFKLPKREKTREIELSHFAATELRRHLRDHGPFFTLSDSGPLWRRPTTEADALLFRGGRSAPLRRDAFYDIWRASLEGAGLAPDRYVFHSLRHWTASTMLASRRSAPEVAGHLGDVPETVMRTYAHWLRDDREGLGTVLDQALAGSADERVVGGVVPLLFLEAPR